MGRINQELKSIDTDVLVIGGGSAAVATKLGLSLKLPFPVLIDKKGTIRYILRATNPRNSFDKDELLKAISTL